MSGDDIISEVLTSKKHFISLSFVYFVALYPEMFYRYLTSFSAENEILKL